MSMHQTKSSRLALDRGLEGGIDSKGKHAILIIRLKDPLRAQWLESIPSLHLAGDGYANPIHDIVPVWKTIARPLPTSTFSTHSADCCSSLQRWRLSQALFMQQSQPFP